jgi:hypothetical protein
MVANHHLWNISNNMWNFIFKLSRKFGKFTFTKQCANNKNNERILPCNNIACTDCIKKFMDVRTGVLHCNLYTNDHRISNFDHRIESNLSRNLKSNKSMYSPFSHHKLKFKSHFRGCIRVKKKRIKQFPNKQTLMRIIFRYLI